MTDKALTLAFDTYANQLAVALHCAHTGWSDAHIEPATKGGDKIHSAIDALLKKNSKTLQDVALVAIPLGPGSFTGIRIGLSTAQGLSMALGIPVVGLPSFEVLAHPHFQKNQKVLIQTDAHGGMVFAQTFEANGTPSENIVCRPEKDIVVPDDATLVKDAAIDPVLLATLGEEKHKQNSQQPLKPLYIKPLTYKKLAEQGK